jgi:hypothetical protein
MSTRKYPRTMNEAFPHTADYASAVERPHRHDSIVMVACAIAAVSLVCILFVWG